MFKDLKIKYYRGLRGISLPDLQQINIIIGDNNSGKTSLLEAVQLFDGSNVLANAISIARKREAQLSLSRVGQMLPFDMLLYSFPMYQDWEKEIYVSGYSDKLGECRAGIRCILEKEQLSAEEIFSQKNRTRRLFFSSEDGLIRSLSGEYIMDSFTHSSGSFHFHEFQTKPVIDESNKEKKTDRKVSSSDRKRTLFISPLDIYTNKIISSSLYKGMLVEEKYRLLDLLRLFDERIRGIETGIQSGQAVTLIELEDCGLVPVSIFGDGLKKVLTLASAIVKMRGGIVLIDEFETGIHKRALIRVAQWLAAVSARYDVQIFLTTHSSEAIEALVSVQEYSQSINAYRLEHYKSDIYVKTFSGNDLNKLIKNQGMDIL